MSWRAAFLRQAVSDNEIRLQLARSGAAYCHQLHYLQMTTEKLGKGLLQGFDDQTPPVESHVAFVRLLQVVKTSREFRRHLGYTDASSFRSYLNSLMELARRVEALAPAVAGANAPNAEYPWLDIPTDRIIPPVDFAFPGFDPRSPRMIKLDKLIISLLDYT